MNRCLLCYEPLEASFSGEYHVRCSSRFFGLKTAPELPYSVSELDDLAKIEVKRSVTVTGVQSKLSLELEQTVNHTRLTIVGLWGTYILKPPSKEYPELAENEDLIMHLADGFRINTVPHGLIRMKSGELAYLSRRIDRIQDTKLAMEDFCQLSERLTEDKYKGSYEQAAKVIDRYSSTPGLDKVRFFELILFALLTGNSDMHLKNFSLIRNPEGTVTLTPFYDLLSTRLVLESDEEETALTLNGKKKNIRLNDVVQFGKTIGLNEKVIGNILKKFQNSESLIEGVLEKGFLPLLMKEKLLSLIRSGLEKLKPA